MQDSSSDPEPDLEEIVANEHAGKIDFCVFRLKKVQKTSLRILDEKKAQIFVQYNSDLSTHPPFFLRKYIF